MLLGKYDYKYCLGTIERERQRERDRKTDGQRTESFKYL